MTKNRIEIIFSRLQQELPVPKTELVYLNPYTLLVSVVMSAQATDVGVNKATGPLFKVVDTPHKMVELGVEKLKDYIKTINYYPTKAKNIIALSHMLLDRFQNKVPDTREELEQLPGVGRKTANVVLNVAFGHHTIAVDTHILRVCNRLGIASGKNPRAVEDKLNDIVPEKYIQYAHHWLILHGRYICKARRPECERCFLTDVCDYYQQTISLK